MLRQTREAVQALFARLANGGPLRTGSSTDAYPPARLCVTNRIKDGVSDPVLRFFIPLF